MNVEYIAPKRAPVIAELQIVVFRMDKPSGEYNTWTEAIILFTNKKFP